jgi:cold shock CspA family protein
LLQQIAAMPSASASLKQQQAYLAIAQRMFKKDPVGEKVDSELVGQLDFWDDAKNFGFIRTRDEKFYCHGSAFSKPCAVKEMVKFDVWENLHTGSQKAINVKASDQPPFTVIARDRTGTIVRWLSDTKGIIKEAPYMTYTCTEDDFEEGLWKRTNLRDRVRFDIVEDYLTGRARAINIRSTKTVYLSEVEGRVVKLANSYGFVSLYALGDKPDAVKDLHFNCKELKETDITWHSRIICDVIESDGALTAANLRLWRPALDTVDVKAPAVDDDSASTSTKAATDVPPL